jgi:hypothetical protein
LGDCPKANIAQQTAKAVSKVCFIKLIAYIDVLL